MNLAKFLDWLKQPSTIKAIVIAAGMAGWTITPEYQERILFVGGVIYAGLGAFYDQQPRTPVDPPSPEAVPLTEARFRELLAEARAKKTQPPAG